MIVSAAGVLLVGWLPSLCAPLYPLIGAGIIAVLSFLTGQRRLLPGALFLCGMAYGAHWGNGLLAERLPAALEGEPLAATFTVLEPPQWRRFSGGGQRQRFAARVRLDDCPDVAPGCDREIGRVLLAWYGETPMRAGDVWRAGVRLKRPRGLANPGSFNYEAWLSRHRFAATGHVRRNSLERLATGRGAVHQRWRQSLSEGLEVQAMEPRVRGVLLALTTGDRSGIDPDLWRRFQRYGLNHLVVISGLHVGLVAGIGFLLGRLVGLRSAHLAAAGLALIYSALAGFALPTVRALAMLASVQLAALLGRTLRPWRSLGLAVLLVAVLEPLASHSAGFWLSFGAVALILTIHGFYPDWPAWRLTLLLQVSLSLTVGLVASFWFGGMGWIAPLANVVAVPVLTFWLAPLCLAGAVLAGVAPGAAGLCWTLAGLPVSGFLAVDSLLEARLPALWLDFRPGLPAMLAALAGCLLLVARPGWPQRWMAGLFFAAALFPARPQSDPERLEFWLLDVGQGLAVAVLHREHVLVYDTGAGDPAGPNMADAVLIPFLESRGVQGIDVLVISHGDRDHSSGVYSLHRRFAVGQTWYGEAAPLGLPGQRPCRAGARHTVGDLRLEVLSPQDEDGEGNNRSCVLRLRFGNLALLLPGDIEASVERELLRRRRDALASNVLVAPHHGSRSSSSSAFLAAVRPELVLLSRGYRNRFGHPHPEVTARYAHFGLPVCDTAGLGAVRLVLDRERIRTVAGWRNRRPRYWHGVASPDCAPAYNGAQDIHR
jgi:competence protein ComEC